MLHLLLVGLGERAVVKDMIAAVEAFLRRFCRETNSNVYDLEQLWRSEAQPERLKAKGRVTPATKAPGQWRDYSGVMDCQDYQELYSRYCARDVGRYLLGAEHTIYVGNGMQLPALPGMAKRELKNGSLYTAPGTLWDFDRQALTLPLIPACGIHVWSNFWGSCRQYHQKPQSIHIYAKTLQDVANPTVVLAYGLGPEQVDKAAGFQGKYAMERMQRS